jgi:hypothetical protein
MTSFFKNDNAVANDNLSYGARQAEETFAKICEREPEMRFLAGIVAAQAAFLRLLVSKDIVKAEEVLSALSDCSNEIMQCSNGTEGVRAVEMFKSIVADMTNAAREKSN